MNTNFDFQMELDWLKRWNLYSPDAVAIKDGETGTEYTYADFYAYANSGSFVLSKQFSISKGDRVAVLATNELEYVFLFFALQRLGAILVPINFRLTQREVDHIISDCEPKLVVYQSEFQKIIDQVPGKSSKLILQSHEGTSFSSLLRQFKAERTAMLAQAHDPAMIIYTSGTTGSPKGAVITHKMIFWNSINTTLSLNITQADCTVIFLPFFHTGGWHVLTTPFLHRGAKVVFLKKFDADQILSLSAQEKATILFGVPTTMDMMAHSKTFAEVNLQSIRYAIVGGEPMPIELIKVWDKKGIPIRQGYGLTEFGPNVFSLHQRDAIRKIGSIGFPNFYIEAQVRDENGTELGPDQVGELVLKGPMCMDRYWKNEKATAETIMDGWLHTGDLVKKDTEGYFYVVGRKKDMYKSGGENVYPPELEQVMRKIPGVRDVAVIGVPDSKWGEVGKAFIVLDGSYKPAATEVDIQAYCLKNLAKFKIPKYFTFLPELPKGDSGKILKRQLRDL